MRNTFLFLATPLIAGVMATGCANTEKKFGRGVSNTCEIVRMGELRRSVEQTTLFDGSSAGCTTGLFRGLTRTLARTGVGVYEIATAPLPPYGPIFTDYLAPNPVWPDSYKPGIVEDSTFATDTQLGFSGGDVAPFVPGSRFSIFSAP
jgi:putative exosortase-associated protein (TIGR04073 family)